MSRKLAFRFVIFCSLFFTLVFLRPNNSLAHPGNTASDGCHYCRTNCGRWGVPWNERHCHGGSISLPPAAPPPPPPPPPAPKIETWTFNGKTYYSYNAYLEAKASYEAEQRQKQVEDNKRLQQEIDRLKTIQQTPSSNQTTGSVAGIALSGTESGDTDFVVGAIAIAGILACGWYYFRKNKSRDSKNYD